MNLSGWRAVTLPLLAGFCLAASVPPWGFWPLAFVGFALLDLSIGEQSMWTRFWRTWLACAAWLYPAMLWMADLTLPGYIIAGAAYAAYHGAAAAITPGGPSRRVVYPGIFALTELARWWFPFGGVPLANLALAQVDSPLGQTASLGGPLFVIALSVVIGQMATAVLEVRILPIVGGAVVVVGSVIAAAIPTPGLEVGEEVTVALVQGGGPQGTRAAANQAPIVLARHVEATKLIDRPVDLILWPENVVNPGSSLSIDEAIVITSEIARQRNATLLPGWFYAVPTPVEGTVNYHSAIWPDGTEVDRYDKVRTVPFGEFVPFRGLLESTGLAEGIPRRDVIPGSAAPVLDTPVGPMGVAISWEAYFEHRSRHAVREGAEVLLNPTNGSSYWLTQVQTQQVASNQLRAIENDRWVLMVGPTGLSAVIDPDGNVLDRSDVGERKVLYATVERRTGRTLQSYLGPWPVSLFALCALAWGINRERGE